MRLLPSQPAAPSFLQEDIEEIRANRKHRRLKLMQRSKAGSPSRSPGRDSQGRDSPGALPQREVVVRTLSFDGGRGGGM